MQAVGCQLQAAGSRRLGLGCRLQVGCELWTSGSTVQAAGCRVWGVGCRLYDRV